MIRESWNLVLYINLQEIQSVSLLFPSSVTTETTRPPLQEGGWKGMKTWKWQGWTALWCHNEDRRDQMRTFVPGAYGQKPVDIIRLYQCYENIQEMCVEHMRVWWLYHCIAERTVEKNDSTSVLLHLIKHTSEHFSCVFCMSVWLRWGDVLLYVVGAGTVFVSIIVVSLSDDCWIGCNFWRDYSKKYIYIWFTHKLPGCHY